jgi:NMD protein affecting ribosome stability and mRNA decay
MPEIVVKNNKRSVQKSRHEMQEFGPGKKGVAVCNKCGAYYFKKSWHHDAAAFLGKRENRGLETAKILCPACQMIKNNQFEGKVIIKKAPAELVSELENMIDNYCARAYEKDPMDRMISMKKEKGDYVVTMTENQLAQKLARKIEDSFNNVKVTVRHESEPGDVATAVVEFGAK